MNNGGKLKLVTIIGILAVVFVAANIYMGIINDNYKGQISEYNKSINNRDNESKVLDKRITTLTEKPATLVIGIDELAENFIRIQERLMAIELDDKDNEVERQDLLDELNGYMLNENSLPFRGTGLLFGPKAVKDLSLDYSVTPTMNLETAELDMVVNARYNNDIVYLAHLTIDVDKTVIKNATIYQTDKTTEYQKVVEGITSKDGDS